MRRYRIRATPTSPWSTPVPIAELNTTAEDESAFLLPGDLDVMFASSITGNRDLYEAVRPAIGEPFGTVRSIDSLNTPSDDSDPWLSPDGHTIVFSSNRSGTSEVWRATR